MLISLAQIKTNIFNLHMGERLERGEGANIMLL